MTPASPPGSRTWRSTTVCWRCASSIAMWRPSAPEGTRSRPAEGRRFGGRGRRPSTREASMLRAVLTMHLNAIGRGIERDPAPVLASAAEADSVLLRPLDLPDGPVVVSPVAGLHDLPWGLLPSLQARSFVLAPSVALWRRCRAVTAGVPSGVVAIAGPHLPYAAA